MSIWRNGSSVLLLTSTLAGTFTLAGAPPANEWEGPGAPELTVTLTVEQVNTFAPSGVHFYVNVAGSAYTSPVTFGPGATGRNAYNPALHRQHVVISTGDTGNYDTLRTPFTSWSSKAYQYGHFGKHAYHNQGDYIARAYVYDDDGKWGMSDEATISVASALSAAVPTQRIVVSNDPAETWGDAPDHGGVVANRCTTLAAAWSRVQALKETGPVLILVHGGQTFTENLSIATNTFSRTAGPGWVVVMRGGAWGSTARSTLNDRDATGANSGGLFTLQNSSSPNFIISGFDFVFDWNAQIDGVVPGTGGVQKRRNLFGMGDGTPSNSYYIFSDVTITGAANSTVFFNNGVPNDGKSAFFSNYRVSNSRDFAIFQMVGRVALLGFTFETPEGTPLGNSGRDRHGISHIYHAHGAIRESLSYELYIRNFSTWHRHSWPGDNSGVVGFGDQPSWRINDGSTGDVLGGRNDKYVYLADVYVEGTFGTGAPTRWPNMVFENILHIRPPTSAVDAIGQVKERTTVRNYYGKQFSTPSVTINSIPSRQTNRFLVNAAIGPNCPFLRLEGTPLGDGSQVRIINCQFENHRGAAQGVSAVDRFGSTAGYNLVQAQNLDYAPNLSVPVVPAGGMADTTLPWTISDGWLRWAWERAFITLPTALADGATSGTFPYPNDWYGNATTQASYAGTLGIHAAWGFTNGTYSTSPDVLSTTRPFAANGPLRQQMLAAIPRADSGGTVYQADFSITFGPTGFTFTNTTGATIPSGTLLEVLLNRGSTLMAADFNPLFAIPATEKRLFRVLADVAPEAGPTTLFDMSRRVRPGAGYAISPAGNNTRGPLLPLST